MYATPSNPSYPPSSSYTPPSTPSSRPTQPTTVPPNASSNVSSSSTNSLQIRTPAIPSSFPELDQKSTVELAELHQNTDECQAFVDALDSVRTMRQLRDDLRDGNEELAKKNVACTAEVDELHAVLNAKKEALAQLRNAVSERTSRQHMIMQQLDPSVLVDRLADAAAVADSESEEIASSFLDGIDSDYKEFIKRFTEKRKTYHLRAAKKESTLLSLNHKRQ